VQHQCDVVGVTAVEGRGGLDGGAVDDEVRRPSAPIASSITGMLSGPAAATAACGPVPDTSSSRGAMSSR